MKHQSIYGMRVNVPLPFEQTVDKVVRALSDEGFGVLTTIDVRDTLRRKLGRDFRPYIILGACNPQIAFEALSAELEVGLLLPCNVVIYEEGECCVVAVYDPELLMETTGNPALEPVSVEAKDRIERVLATLVSQPA